MESWTTMLRNELSSRPRNQSCDFYQFNLIWAVPPDKHTVPNILDSEYPGTVGSGGKLIVWYLYIFF